jgi:hypothetical protein
MSSLTISLVAFAFIFGGALAGMILRTSLPDHHLSAESKDVVKLGMGLVGTMAALILGLLVASAKSSFDAQSSELTQASANIVVLDRVLAQYGPETKEVRGILRGAVARIIEDTWSHDRHASSQFGGHPQAVEFSSKKFRLSLQRPNFSARRSRMRGTWR